MSKKGENIYKRQDGRWEARYPRGRDGDGKIRYGYCYGRTYTEVREKIRGLSLTPSASARLPGEFRVCCEDFLREKRLSVKEASLTKYDQMIRRHLLPFFEDEDPRDIGSEEIFRFSEQLRDTSLSAKSIRDVLTLLRQIIGFSYERVFADAPKMKYLFPKERKKEIRVLSMEEQQRFDAFLRKTPDRFRVGILLALYTGMRIGEVCALREEDVFLTEGVIRVRQTVQRIRNMDGGGAKTKLIFDSPKSDSSARVIPLTGKAAALCADWASGDPKAFFLTGREDEWVEPRLLQYHFGQYAKACGLTGLHFHVLRHTFATRCVEVGVEIKSLSEILGHSSPRVTLERYVHSSLLLKKESMEKLTAVGM